MKAKQQKLPTETEEQKVEKYKDFELRTKNGYKLDEIVSSLQDSGGIVSGGFK